MKPINYILPSPRSLFFTGFLLCIVIFLVNPAHAQRCGTVVYQQMRNDHFPLLKDKVAFEQWLRQRKERRGEAGIAREEATIYTIPVVVHIVHNGEPIGVDANISVQQILSQIAVLTEDFRRMNADATETPAMYLPIAADVELEFALAQRDPEGISTTGIVRIDGQKSEWRMEENYELKSLSYWPAEDYLNIWVTDISGVYLGYAQFPTSTDVEGLDDSSNSRLTDGVVIDYKAFGSKEKYPPANLVNDYALGRTTTHEVGHFFGLRHIWGDDSGGCSASDYVDDTPNQGGSTQNCPEANTTSCNSMDMIQNYMDYTDDACMNLFTSGQKDRIRVILENSPRRASLTVSQGAIPPVIFSNDLGIRRIITPSNFACSGVNIPALEVRNYGDNNITSAQITILLDNEPLETATFPLDLDPLEIDVIEFSAVNLNTSGDYVISFEIEAVNNTTDGKVSNNFLSENIMVPESIAVPMREDFNDVPTAEIPSQWTLLNPDNQLTWRAVDANNGETGNTSLYMNFYNYEIEGEYDSLLTPVFNLTDIPFAILSFARAYAVYPGISNEEGLIIKLSTNCGQTFEHTLYESYGDELATTTRTSTFFTPQGSEDWKRECLILEEFLGLPNIRIAFISKNGHGNNLYIDDVFLDTSDDASDLKDIGILSLNQPALVSCPQAIEPTVIVKNQGCTIENEFTLSYQFDNGPVLSTTYTAEAIEPGQTREIALDGLNFDMGKHTYMVEFTDINDTNISNDQIAGNFYINNERDNIPTREDFENFTSSDWLIANRTGSALWQTTATNNGTSLYLNAEAADTNQEEWLVSPVLDFANAQDATLSFELAYSYAEESKDGLKILVSTNCGIHYDEVAFNKFGEDLNTGDFSGPPESDEDWSEIGINMSQYLGETDVRIAFIATSANGNDIFLDNIQTFVTPHSITGINEIYPNPSHDGIIHITFDLPEKETVQFTMYNTKGQILSEQIFSNTLNQTYTFDLSNQGQGLYLIKVVGESFSYIKRIILLP
ncbi:MAG: choice-of-anchor J domain-containing protein [Fulvivirga sp.]